jgi:hypothetical protein
LKKVQINLTTTKQALSDAETQNHVQRLRHESNAIAVANGGANGSVTNNGGASAEPTSRRMARQSMRSSSRQSNNGSMPMPFTGLNALTPTNGNGISNGGNSTVPSRRASSNQPLASLTVASATLAAITYGGHLSPTPEANTPPPMFPAVRVAASSGVSSPTSGTIIGGSSRRGTSPKPAALQLPSNSVAYLTLDPLLSSSSRRHPGSSPNSSRNGQPGSGRSASPSPPPSLQPLSQADVDRLLAPVSPSPPPSQPLATLQPSAATGQPSTSASSSTSSGSVNSSPSSNGADIAGVQDSGVQSARARSNRRAGARASAAATSNSSAGSSTSTTTGGGGSHLVAGIQTVSSGSHRHAHSGGRSHSPQPSGHGSPLVKGSVAERAEAARKIFAAYNIRSPPGQSDTASTTSTSTNGATTSGNGSTTTTTSGHHGSGGSRGGGSAGKRPPQHPPVSMVVA